MKSNLSQNNKELLYQWLLDSGEPWTRYRTMIDLLEMSHDHSQVQNARNDLLSHLKVQELISDCSQFPGYPLKRHNDARHVIHKLAVLADFGIKSFDPGMQEIIREIMDHQTSHGAFQILLNIPTVFGGTGEDMWSWILCDFPLLLYSLIALGLAQEEDVRKSIHYLESLVDENGYRCRASQDLGKFRGPGRKSDPCPIANLYTLKALSMAPEKISSSATNPACEVILRHWEYRGEIKLFLFGVGTDFNKLKYPFIWYDILHVAEVLSRFPSLYQDNRFVDLITAIRKMAGVDGRYVPGSMYQAWKGWSFADKKNPSPWLTFLVLRILKRIENMVRLEAQAQELET